MDYQLVLLVVGTDLTNKILVHYNQLQKDSFRAMPLLLLTLFAAVLQLLSDTWLLQMSPATCLAY